MFSTSVCFGAATASGALACFDVSGDGMTAMHNAKYNRNSFIYASQSFVDGTCSNDVPFFIKRTASLRFAQNVGIHGLLVTFEPNPTWRRFRDKGLDLRRRST